MYVTSGGSVSGDVDVRVGITDHYNTFIYGADYMNKRSYFNGVSDTTVPDTPLKYERLFI